jgi:hypothetical protein
MQMHTGQWHKHLINGLVRNYETFLVNFLVNLVGNFFSAYCYFGEK